MVFVIEENSRVIGVVMFYVTTWQVLQKKEKKKEKEKKNEHHASGMEWKTKDESRLESRANIFWAISERDQEILSIGFIPSGDKGGRYTKWSSRDEATSIRSSLPSPLLPEA